ncbi:hypothetical protein OUZ56_012072 [Daphnia magna]|uniref:Uncharacterized protein n=1 Tax=Daphnia magna TaxID=35525 RepID=A0ABQ9Z1Y9_9CRUS|nr:hypothetical protein OUZ56_012072 [Daphnia magna]
MEGYALVMGPKLFIVSPGVPAGWILHVKVYGIGNEEGGCRLSFVFYVQPMQPQINLEGRHPVVFFQ